MDVRYGIYRATDSETISTAFISDVNVAVVLETHEIEKETINEATESLRESLKVNPPVNLEEFQGTISREFSILQSDSAFSAACGCVVGDVIYVVVIGGGTILVKRGEQVQKVISGSINASGKILPHDVFIFQTASAVKNVSIDLLTESLDSVDLATAAEVLAQKVHEKPGSACLLSSFVKEPLIAIEVAPTLEETLHKDDNALSSRSAGSEREGQDGVSHNTAVSQGSSTSQVVNFPEVRHAENAGVGDPPARSKKITIAAVVILLLLLTWSVVFGVRRRESEIAQKNIATSRDIINAKLEEATNVAPLNIERATLLVADAQNEVSSLKKKVGKKYEKEVAELAQKVSEGNNKIVNKQDKKFEDFYDLSLIDKSATASHLYLDEENLVLLNSSKGEIYTVSASKKSNEVIKKNEIKGAQLVGGYEGTTFFLNKDKGIFTVLDGTVKHPIEKDGLQNPRAMIIFNANIYVLDSDAGDIFKYMAGEDVYSKGTSYFADSQSGILKGAQDLAIDSSIYVLVDGTVIKYTAGVRDTFKLSLPDKTSPNFTHLYTNKDLDNVFLLDTKSGKMVIVSKAGEYSKQIESSIFKQAIEFVVFEEKIIVLSQNKLYSVSL